MTTEERHAGMFSPADPPHGRAALVEGARQDNAQVRDEAAVAGCRA